MTENEIAKIVVDIAYKIHTKLGSGLLESVYEIILAHKLIKSGLNIERQKSISINFEGIKFDEGFRADIIVEDIVIIELKAVQRLIDVHEVQLVNYLTATDKPVGLLINFGPKRVDVKRKVKEL